MAWLTLTENKQYEESWTQTASLTKFMIKKDKWLEMVTAQHKLLGNAKSRRLKSAEYSTDMPTSPETKGEFVTIKFDTDFSEKPGLREMIVSMKDPDGTWRILNYSVSGLNKMR